MKRRFDANKAITVAIGGLMTLALGCGPTAGKPQPGCDPSDPSCTPPLKCTPGETIACYSGAAATKGIGACEEGTRTCNDSGQWGGCVGEVLPIASDCPNGIDDNCNGQVDEPSADLDADGDGFTVCGGDCCDDPTGCTKPELANPGAYDAPGNGFDDDCDGYVDNLTACDTGLASNSTSAADYAKAMDLCQQATLAEQKWGVIEAKLTQPNGAALTQTKSHSIRASYGTNNVPFMGSALAVLSTGVAAAVGQTNPNYTGHQSSLHGSGAAPADWLAYHGGKFPSAPGCVENSTVNDAIMLTLKIRVPSNARSFSFNSNFFSVEYPEWVCTKYNDFYVVLLDSSFSGAPANPPDKNLALYTGSGGAQYPVGVNLGMTGMFKQCVSAACGNTTCTCEGTDGLIGTGMEGGQGGATDWLVTKGNVVPGEIITLRIGLWDVGDGVYDSTILLDNFTWEVEVTEPGTDSPPVS